MDILEVGLSMRQPIRETCFSGYVQLNESCRQLAICVEIEERFEGDGILEVVLLGDSDDGFYSSSEIYRMGPYTAEELCAHDAIRFPILETSPENHLCLWYRVTGGHFEHGKVTARIAPHSKAWFYR